MLDCFSANRPLWENWDPISSAFVLTLYQEIISSNVGKQEHLILKALLESKLSLITLLDLEIALGKVSFGFELLFIYASSKLTFYKCIPIANATQKTLKFNRFSKRSSNAHPLTYRQSLQVDRLTCWVKVTQAVTRPSTDRTLSWLTSEIWREQVFQFRQTPWIYCTLFFKMFIMFLVWKKLELMALIHF